MVTENLRLLGMMSDAERAAARRFLETCDDNEGYDVPKAMMKRLRALGLVLHKGGGYYEGQQALLGIRDELDTWYEESHQRGVAAAQRAIAGGESLDALDYHATDNPGYDEGFFVTLSSARVSRSFKMA